MELRSQLRCFLEGAACLAPCLLGFAFTLRPFALLLGSRWTSLYSWTRSPYFLAVLSRSWAGLELALQGLQKREYGGSSAACGTKEVGSCEVREAARFLSVFRCRRSRCLEPRGHRQGAGGVPCHEELGPWACVSLRVKFIPSPRIKARASHMEPRALL